MRLSNIDADYLNYNYDYSIFRFKDDINKNYSLFDEFLKDDPYPFFECAFLLKELYQAIDEYDFMNGLIKMRNNYTNLFIKGNGITKNKINWHNFFQHNFNLHFLIEDLGFLYGGKFILDKKKSVEFKLQGCGNYRDKFGRINKLSLPESRIMSQTLLIINSMSANYIISYNKNFGWNYNRKNFKSSGISWDYILNWIESSFVKLEFELIDKLIIDFYYSQKKSSFSDAIGLYIYENRDENKENFCLAPDLTITTKI